MQGVTEFLPISSSGHVVIVDTLLVAFHGQKTESTSDVNIILHAGTLLSILVVYWRRIWRLLGQDRRVIPRLVVATLPVVATGLVLHEFFKETVLESPLVAGCFLPVTGLVLLWAARRPPAAGEYADLTYRQALVIGLFQAVAPLPGISRSGMTISGGLAVGLSREASATFAFLLAIPAIGGAVVLDLAKMLRDSSSHTPAGLLALGAAVSLAVGVVSLLWLIRWLKRGHLHHFAYWCIPAGLAVVAWQLLTGA